MEPTEYFKIARRHGKLIALLVVAAVAIVYWTSPQRVTDDHTATHVLLIEGAEGRGAAASANPQVVALWTTVGDVPARVAARLGETGDPSQLAGRITAEGDRNIGTVSITATDPDPERAMLLANTFAEEVVAFLQEREAARVAALTEENSTRADELRTQISDLDAAIAAQTAAAEEAEQEPEIGTLSAERDALVRQLGGVLENLEAQGESAQMSTLQAATSTTQEERLPGTQSREQRMLLAGVVALVLGFGLAVVLDRADTRLRTRHEAETHFGLPVIAEIPMLSLPNRRRKVVVADEPDSIKAESYRTLRAAVMLYRRKDEQITPGLGGSIRPRHERAGAAVPGSNVSGNGRRSVPDREVILITSPGPSDGKTTTVANLAVAYAESGRSVLVLSCDLWRSSVAHRFGVRSGRGVSDFLASSDDPRLETFVRDTEVPGVRVVTGGLAIRRPGGRLVAEQRLIDEARTLADVVILDTAPLLSTSLTRELATMVDAVVVVCRVGRTTVAEAERCGDLLEQLGAPALGVVLVGVAVRPFSDYFAYSSPRRIRKVVAEAEADELAAQAESEADLTGLSDNSVPGHEPPYGARRARSSGADPYDAPAEDR
ncbi:MAG: hypothetical protein ACRDWI_01465 [Jiangellaceae bacterium]